MTSLQKLLSEEGFVRSKNLKSTKQAKLRDESVLLPVYICHDQKGQDFVKQRTDKGSTRKGSSRYSSERVSSDLERRNRDDPAIDEVAIRTVVSILSGYVGRYQKDLSFREMVRNKCRSCLERKRNDFDDAIFGNFELGIESTEKLVEDQGTSKQLRMELLKNSIHLLSIVASMNSENSRNGSTCGVPNSHISACAQLYLSIVYKIEKNDRISATYLLQVFRDSPFLARTHLVPDLWDHLFLPHLLHLKIWYHKELETFSNSLYGEKEKRMKALSEAYNEQIDMGTSQFALYYREWLKVGGKAPPLPNVPLPSRPSSALSKRRSSDSSCSHSSLNKNLYQVVFGRTPEHRLMDLNTGNRNSSDRFEENVYDSCSYSTDKRRTDWRSSSPDYRSSRHESMSERPKSAENFMLFTCQSLVSECLVKGNHIVRSNSITHVEYGDLPLSDISRAISTISSSSCLSDCENAVRVITKSWRDSQGNPVIENALSKASVIEGILEVLFASDDDEILELGISILAEFVSRNETNGLIILNSDPQLEIFIRLLKSSSLFLKAAVLLYLLKPKAKQMISTEWIVLTLRVLEFGDQLQTLFTVRCVPQKAALYFLNELLASFSEDKNLENASQVVSLGGLSLLLQTIEKGEIDERNNAAMLMSCCIRAEGSCRNYLAENVNKTSLLELIALGILNKSNGFAFTLLTELLCLSRRKYIIQFLKELNSGWNGLSTKHIFLVYLQRASQEARPLAAAVLILLDLLGDPLRSSLYREEAVEAIIEALNCQKSSSGVQDQSAKALLMLGSRFSYSGEATAEEWLLQHTACQNRSNEVYFRNHIIDGNLIEEEKAVEHWQQKVISILLNSGRERFLKALSSAIADGTPNLVQSCLYTVAWMNRVLYSVDNRTLLADEATEICDSERALLASSLPSELPHLIKSSECVSMLSTLGKELIYPLGNPF